MEMIVNLRELDQEFDCSADLEMFFATIKRFNGGNPLKLDIREDVASFFH